MNYLLFCAQKQEDKLTQCCCIATFNKASDVMRFVFWVVYAGAFTFSWVMGEAKRSFDLSFLRKYTEIMVEAITFIMEVESYSQIYYDYIARTIRDLLLHFLLGRKSVLRPSFEKRHLVASAFANKSCKLLFIPNRQPQ